MDNTQFDLSWLWATLTAGGSSLVTWIFTRRKQNAEASQAEEQAKTSELDNVEKAVAIWRGIASDLEGKFAAVQKQVNDIQIELYQVKVENAKLKAENAELKSELEELRLKLPQK